jgi:hypothetical protein
MTTGLPLGALNTRRAAIRRILGGAAKDLLIRLGGIVSGGGAESLDALQQTASRFQLVVFWSIILNPMLGLDQSPPSSGFRPHSQHVR